MELHTGCSQNTKEKDRNVLADIMQYEFLRNGLAAGILASILCGVVGSYIVVRRIVFISGGVSHAAFGGIGLGYYLGFNPVLGAVLFSIASALTIGAATRFVKQAEDTVIGILWALGMALGILFISLTPGYAPDLFSYLFGNILTVPAGDIKLMLVLNGVVILVAALFYKDILAISFDEEFAKIQGRPVNFIYFLMLGAVGLTIVVVIKIVGIILVISLMTIPAAVSVQFCKKLSMMMVMSAVLGTVFTLAGLFLSYRYDLQSGATIILTSAAGYLVAMASRFFYSRISSGAKNG
jgi:zinc transport system permease protein